MNAADLASPLGDDAPHLSERALLRDPCSWDNWDFVAEISFGKTEVTWSDFRQRLRSWDYSALGPFVFDRKQYEQEAAKLWTAFWQRVYASP